MKLCQTVPLSIIRSFSLYTQQWYMSYRFADSLRAGSGWNILILIWLYYRRNLSSSVLFTLSVYNVALSVYYVALSVHYAILSVYYTIMSGYYVTQCAMLHNMLHRQYDMLYCQYTVLYCQYTMSQCQYIKLYKTVQTVYISQLTFKLYPIEVR